MTARLPKWLAPRHWTLRRVVLVVPIVSLIVVLMTALIGLNAADRQIYRFGLQVERSLDYHDNTLQIPYYLEKIRSQLYRLDVLKRSGASQMELATMRRMIGQDIQQVMSLRRRLDLRIQSDDLRQILIDLRENILATQIAILRGEVDPTFDIGNSDLIAQASMMAADLAGESTALIFDDLNHTRDEAVGTATLTFAVLALIGAAISLAAWWAARALSRPILALAHTVEALEHGALDTPIPAIKRRDEVGKVARAMLSFRTTLQKNAQLQAERDALNRDLEQKLANQKAQLLDAYQRSDQQRQDMTTQLRQQFGQVINAASAGDFDQRVVTSFADPNLQALAGDINEFVGKVDSSVKAIGASMHDMAAGGHVTEGRHEFTGAFADIMTQIRDTAAQIRGQAQQLSHLALHDALTGLPNRRFLEEKLATYDKRVSSGTVTLAALHIDLDHFKDINDTLGHAAGDHVLQHTAEVLRKIGEKDDFIARIGGDEFTMLCPMTGDDTSEKQRIKRIGTQIITDLGRPIGIGNQTVHIGASIGIAFSTSDTSDLAQLLVDADVALYQSKDGGRNQAQIFSSDIASALLRQRTLRDELRSAVDRGEFVPYFQPKHDAKTHALTGVEALARWDHPSRGIITPDRFLPEAEELGIVQEIDNQILHVAAATLVDIARDGVITIPSLSVNVSQQRLSDPILLKSLEGLSGPFRLTFELLESIFFDEQGDHFQWMLDALRERDIGIEIDDFGSGRASISALINLRPERLKIDRNLIRPMLEKDGNLQVIKGIADIAASMKIGITAEGVETMEHAGILRDLGCDTLQGYVFSKPVPAAALTTLGQRAAG